MNDDNFERAVAMLRRQRYYEVADWMEEQHDKQQRDTSGFQG